MAPEQRSLLIERARKTRSRGCVSAPIVPYTRAEWLAALALGADYRRLGWSFSATELARLRFVRWLIHSGRLVG